MGHVARCSAVAFALCLHGVAVACVGLGAKANFEFDRVRWKAGDLQETLSRMRIGTVILVDSYDIPPSELSRSASVVCFHDGSEEPHRPMHGL